MFNLQDAENTLRELEVFKPSGRDVHDYNNCLMTLRSCIELYKDERTSERLKRLENQVNKCINMMHKHKAQRDYKPEMTLEVESMNNPKNPLQQAKKDKKKEDVNALGAIPNGPLRKRRRDGSCLKAESFLDFCEEQDETVDGSPGIRWAGEKDDNLDDVELGMTDQELDEFAKMWEADPSLQPPKRWWNKMAKSGKAPELIGYIWYHKLSPEKRAEIRGREGKSYGPAKKD